MNIKKILQSEYKTKLELDTPDSIDDFDIAYSKVYCVEKNYDGVRAIIHKLNNKVKIFSEFKKDITKGFPTIVKQVKKLSNFNFIIDGVLVPYHKGKGIGEKPLIAYLNKIKKGEKLKDESIKLHVFDAVYFNDKTLQNLRLYERKKVLNTMNWTKNILHVKPLIVRDRNELGKAVRVMSDLPGSKGIIIKSFNGTYLMSGETNNWIVLKEEKVLEKSNQIKRKN